MIYSPNDNKLKHIKIEIDMMKNELLSTMQRLRGRLNKTDISDEERAEINGMYKAYKEIYEKMKNRL